LMPAMSYLNRLCMSIQLLYLPGHGPFAPTVLLPTVLQWRVWKLAYTLVFIVSKSMPLDFNKYIL
jgi:hypothetical protein